MSSGQSLIEALLGVVLISGILIFGLPAMYTAYAKTWFRHVLYEAAICKSALPERTDCVSRARSFLKITVPIGHLDVLQISGNAGTGRAQGRLRISKRLLISDRVDLRAERSAP